MKKIRFVAKKKHTAAIAGLAALAVIGATFAWFSESVDLKNEFRTGDYKTEITEKFEPPSNWRPGMETDKSVFVENKGDIPVVVRVKFSDAWFKPENEQNADMNLYHYTDINGDRRTEEAALKNFNWENCTRDTGDASKGEKWYVHYETVQINEGGEARTVSIPSEAYYLTTLSKGMKTVEALRSVTMNPNIIVDKESTVTEVKNESGAVIGTKVVTESVSPYADAKYELTITAETVQADKEAVLSAWDDSFGENKKLTKEEQTTLLSCFGFDGN